jgi:hypothetical protein
VSTSTTPTGTAWSYSPAPHDLRRGVPRLHYCQPGQRRKPGYRPGSLPSPRASGGSAHRGARRRWRRWAPGCRRPPGAEVQLPGLTADPARLELRTKVAIAAGVIGRAKYSDLHTRRADHRSRLRGGRPGPVAGPAVHAVPAGPPGHPGTPRPGDHLVSWRQPRPGGRSHPGGRFHPGGRSGPGGFSSGECVPGGFSTSGACGPRRRRGPARHGLAWGLAALAGLIAGAGLLVSRTRPGPRHRCGVPGALCDIGFRPGRARIRTRRTGVAAGLIGAKAAPVTAPPTVAGHDRQRRRWQRCLRRAARTWSWWPPPSRLHLALAALSPAALY